MPLIPKNDDPCRRPDFFAFNSTPPSPDGGWSSFSQFVCSPPPLQEAAVSSHDKLPDIFNEFSPGNFAFDHMMVNPTQPASDVVDVALEDRAVKERRLQEMREATKKLEEELAAS